MTQQLDPIPTPSSPAPSSAPAAAAVKGGTSTISAIVKFMAGQSWVWNILGLGFGGTAVYGFVTGRMSQASLTAVVALAATYTGIKGQKSS